MDKYKLLNRIGYASTLLFVGAISQAYLLWIVLIYGIIMALSLLLVLITDSYRDTNESLGGKDAK